MEVEWVDWCGSVNLSSIQPPQLCVELSWFVAISRLASYTTTLRESLTPVPSSIGFTKNCVASPGWPLIGQLARGSTNHRAKKRSQTDRGASRLRIDTMVWTYFVGPDKKTFYYSLNNNF
jgi:hypothetical protein